MEPRACVILVRSLESTAGLACCCQALRYFWTLTGFSSIEQQSALLRKAVSVTFRCMAEASSGITRAGARFACPHQEWPAEQHAGPRISRVACAGFCCVPTEQDIDAGRCGIDSARVWATWDRREIACTTIPSRATSMSRLFCRCLPYPLDKTASE